MVRNGNQSLGAYEAVLVNFGGKTYLVVNNNQAAFDARRDLVIDVTRIQLNSGDGKSRVLTVSN